MLKFLYICSIQCPWYSKVSVLRSVCTGGLLHCSAFICLRDRQMNVDVCSGKFPVFLFRSRMTATTIKRSSTVLTLNIWHACRFEEEYEKTIELPEKP